MIGVDPFSSGLKETGFAEFCPEASADPVTRLENSNFMA